MGNISFLAFNVNKMTGKSILQAIIQEEPFVRKDSIFALYACIRIIEKKNRLDAYIVTVEPSVGLPTESLLELRRDF